MTIKALMLTSAVASAVAICVPINASRGPFTFPRERGYYGRAYMPPAGQIYERGWRNGITRDQRVRQDSVGRPL
jgi:hypothetical protein